MAIPLPTLLRGWRDRSWREGLEPTAMRSGIGLWAFVARRPRPLPAGERRWASARCGCSAGGGWIASLPLAGAWTAQRDLPAPAGADVHGAVPRAAGAKGSMTGTRERILRRSAPAWAAPGSRRRRSPPRPTALLADPELIRPDLARRRRWSRPSSSGPPCPRSARRCDRVREPGRPARRRAAATSRPAACRSPSRCSRQPELSAWTGRGSRLRARAGARTSRSASASPAGASPRPARSSSTPAPTRRSCRLPAAAPHRGAAGGRRSCAYLEDYAALLGRPAAPRNAILITGASGTTDIEGSYVRGAHGPGYLHVVLIEERPGS